MHNEEYLKLAEVEDRMWYFRSLHSHVRRELRRGLTAGGALSRAGAPPHVLDAGCGTGGLIIRLRKMEPKWKWAGIDFMPIACELARERCGLDVDIRVASITELPFEDESFDAVVSLDVVCQVENPEVAVKEFFRVLRPGGIVVINVPAYMWMWSYHDDACQTKHRYTRPEIDALMSGAGFQQRRTTHWNALPFPAVWAKRKLFRRSDDISDMKEYPKIVDAAFDGLMSLEHAWVNAGGRWAWGTSVFGVARKPGAARE